MALVSEFEDLDYSKGSSMMAEEPRLLLDPVPRLDSILVAPE